MGTISFFAARSTCHVQTSRWWGKKTRGSGMSDIFLKAGLISSGSLEGVVSGKHYERSLHCHKSILECLECLLMEQFVQHRNDNKILDNIRKRTQEKLAFLVSAPGRDEMESVCGIIRTLNYLMSTLKGTWSTRRKFVLSSDSPTWTTSTMCYH